MPKGDKPQDSKSDQKDDRHAAAPEHFEDLELGQFLRHFRGVADVDDIANEPVTRSAWRRA